MPGLVSSFLRTTSEGLVHKKKTQNTTSAYPSPSPSPYSSDHEEHFDMRQVKKAFVEKLRRHSAGPELGPLEIDCLIETPAVVFHGAPADAGSEVVAGQMVLNVREEHGMDIEAFTASLELRLQHKRAHHKDCKDCQSQITELKKFEFITQSVHLTQGKHYYPFTVLLDGHLPASVQTNILNISYDFKAEATPARATAEPSFKPAKFERQIPVTRTLPTPDPEVELQHQSVRVFDKTSMKSKARYNSVITPNGANLVHLELDGLVGINEKTSMLDMWKVKKVTWKVEQVVRTVAQACEEHAPAPSEEADLYDAVPNSESKVFGTLRTDRRILGEKILHKGWDADYSPDKGTFEMDFKTSLNFTKESAPHTRSLRSLRWVDGATSIAHILHVELVVSKEYAHPETPHHSAPTGTGRILRMTYNLSITDGDSGEHVSYDDETPPLYEDVDASPPAYPPIPAYEDLETLSLYQMGGTSCDVSRRGSEAGASEED